MSSPTMVQLCGKLLRDSDAGIREIGKRCMREYDEFSGMRYAHLTARDRDCVAAAARAARTSDDPERAGLLDAAELMISEALAS